MGNLTIHVFSAKDEGFRRTVRVGSSEGILGVSPPVGSRVSVLGLFRVAKGAHPRSYPPILQSHLPWSVRGEEE